VRLTDRTAPTNFTLLQQSGATCNIDNGNVNSTTINLKTKTSGGASVTPLSLSSTAVTANFPITLGYTTQPASSQIGHITKYNGTASATAMVSTTVYNLTTSGNTIPAGTYSVSIYFRATHTAVAGSVQTLKIGISTGNTGFAGGFNDVVVGSASIPAAAGEIVGQLTQTLYVSSTTTFYLLAQMSFTTIVPTTVPSTCSAQWTRIA
jgi:hypothetical protein